MITMPFLYRYAGMDYDQAVGTPLSLVGSAGSAVSANIQFYTGDTNLDSDWLLGKFVRLHTSSQPQMSFNVPVDTGVSSISTARYDVRVLVAVIDPANNLDDANDLVYVRTVMGHTNITSNLEALGYTGWPSAPAYTGVWGSTTGTLSTLVGATSPSPSSAKPWTTSLNGFTALGPIVAGANGEFTFTVPGAPGIVLHFGATNIVHSDGKGRWFEILVKLPACSSRVLKETSDFTDILGGALQPVDSQIENIPCAGRGACDASTGTCKCYGGFYGRACHRM